MFLCHFKILLKWWQSNVEENNKHKSIFPSVHAFNTQYPVAVQEGSYRRDAGHWCNLESSSVVALLRKDVFRDPQNPMKDLWLLVVARWGPDCCQSRHDVCRAPSLAQPHDLHHPEPHSSVSSSLAGRDGSCPSLRSWQDWGCECWQTFPVFIVFKWNCYHTFECQRDFWVNHSTLQILGKLVTGVSIPVTCKIRILPSVINEDSFAFL